ncbi:MAG: hypothetical protein H0Z28_05880 [Archaeoglobus sp.]|nr:hypothetical protein [Archaeoglobus sp.]
MELEVVRNKPPGARCNTLVENLMHAIAEIIDDLDLELVVRITYAKDVKAPAIRVNGEVLGEDLSMEEIVQRFSVEDLIEILKEIS